jgi:hypothetical protein
MIGEAAVPAVAANEDNHRETPRSEANPTGDRAGYQLGVHRPPSELFTPPFFKVRRVKQRWQQFALFTHAENQLSSNVRHCRMPYVFQIRMAYAADIA